MKLIKDKADNIYERLKANKQPMNLWDYVRNHQFKAEMREEAVKAADPIPRTPDFVQYHIHWLK